MKGNLKTLTLAISLALISGCSSEPEYSDNQVFVEVEDTLDDGTYIPPVSEEALFEEAMRNRPEIREGVGADATAGGRPKGSGGFLANTANLPSIAELGLPSELPVTLPEGVQDPIQHYINERAKFTGEQPVETDTRTLMERVSKTAKKEPEKKVDDKPRSSSSELCDIKNTAKAIEVKASNVISGDAVNIESSTGKKIEVRLLGVAAPKQEQRFYSDSKKNLQRCLARESIHLYYQDTDSKGRILGKFVSAVDGVDCNLEQVKSGYAWHNKSEEALQYEVDRFKYANAEVGARMSDFGLWSEDELVAPWDFKSGSKKTYRFNNTLFDASSASCTKEGRHTS